jgi:hypothetical protein
MVHRDLKLGHYYKCIAGFEGWCAAALPVTKRFLKVVNVENNNEYVTFEGMHYFRFEDTAVFKELVNWKDRIQEW